MTLTEKRVRNAKPGPKLRMLWGTHIKGLGVRIYSSGVKSYYVLSYRTRSDGLPARKRLTTLFPVNIVTLRDVRVQAAKKLVAIRNGEPGPRSNAGRQRTSLTPRSKPPVPDARLHSQLLRHLRTSCRPSVTVQLYQDTDPALRALASPRVFAAWRDKGTGPAYFRVGNRNCNNSGLCSILG